jgi:hypothetical protein
MRVDLMPRRLDLLQAHRCQEYRTFKCSGSCSTEIVALARAALWCGQPGCRGSMKPSYPVSSKRLANEQFQAACGRDDPPPSTPHFLGVLPSEKPGKSTGDGFTHEGDLGGLFGGIAVAQESVIQVLIGGSDGEWNWAPGVGGSR